LETLLNRLFDGATLEIDGMHFVDCTLENCILIYRGGSVIFERTRLRRCRYVFYGPARTTVQLLQTVGLLPTDPLNWGEVDAGEEVH
jgi:hypothetical protein